MTVPNAPKYITIAKPATALVVENLPDLGVFESGKAIRIQLISHIEGVGYASGTSLPQTYQILNGSLPSGLSISQTGLITGTMPVVGANSTFTFTIKVTVIYGPYTLVNSRAYTITASTQHNALVYSVPFNNSLIPAVGSSVGTLTTGAGYRKLFIRPTAGGQQIVYVNPVKYCLLPYHNASDTLLTRLQVDSKLAFMNCSDFTMEFFMSGAANVAGVSFISLYKALQISKTSFPYSGQKDYKGMWAFSLAGHYTASPFSQKYYYVNESKVTGTWSGSAWIHVAIVRQNNTLQMYMNGSNQGYAPTALSGGNIFQINDTSKFLKLQEMNGGIMDFKIFNYAKYTANFVSPTTYANIN